MHLFKIMKTKKIIIGLGILFLNAIAYAQGLEGIVVEKYYQANSADVTNADANSAITPLTTSSVTYRIYVDMASGYKFNSLFGSSTNNLKVNSTAGFFNDPNFGVVINPGTISSLNIRKKTAMLDSYFTTGGVGGGKVGVLKAEDTDGSIGNAQSILANNPGGCFGLPITGIGAQDGMRPLTSSPATYVVPNLLGDALSLDVLDQTDGNAIILTNHAIAALGGVYGPTSTNMVLVAQFTTSGDLTFELNLQIQNTITGAAENYVASNPTGNQLTHPSLTRVIGVPSVLCYQTATYNSATCSYEITGTQPVQPATACYQTATFNSTSCSWVLTGSQPAPPTLACYQTLGSFNNLTCTYNVSGVMPPEPPLECYQTGATFNTTSCQWDIIGTQPVQPTLACYQTAVFDTTSCAWVLSGTQEAQPTGLPCWQTTSFNTISCAWDVSGTQAVQPILACYQTAAFNTSTCAWVVSGTQATQPTGLSCWQTTTFNTLSCAWVVSGTQAVQPTNLSCWQTATFNTGTCAWDVSGTQPVQATLACYETAIFNTTSCAWEVSGTQAPAPTGLACYQSATFDTSSCAWVVSGTQQINATSISACGSFTWGNNGQIYTASGIYFGDTVNCIIQKLILTITAVSSAEINYINSTFCNAETNLQFVSLVGSSGGIYGATPTGLSLDINSGSISPSTSLPGNYIVTYSTQASGSCNSVSDSVFIIISEVPDEPTGLACWQSADLISSSCSWSISGTQPVQPLLACYETAVFNTTSCSWVVSGTQAVQPTNLSCWQTATFNTTSCSWDVSGTQAAQPTNLSCWQTAAFNTTSCSWDVSGTQASEPTNLLCWQTAAFNTSSCSWDVSGTQAPEPTNLSCWQTAAFNTSSCSWDVSGTQAAQPTGLSCWQTASFNSTSCSWDFSGTQVSEPTNLLCWQTAAFSTLTCSWVVIGTQAPEPTNLLCWQTAAFNITSCSWDVSGTQPVQPTLDFCETTLFNVDSCAWIVSSSIQENSVNTDTISPYLWLVNGQTYSSSGTYEFLDTINCVLEILNLVLTNSITEDLTNNLTIYPNPTNGTIVITLPKIDQYTLNVYDSQGKIVFENTSLANSIVHDLSSYRPGLYIFKIILSDLIYTERVIKN